MKKIPTIFVRDMSKQPALVVDRWNEGCEWVRDGEGEPTEKYDGTSCLIRTGKLYKRRELRQGDVAPLDFEAIGTDPETGKTVGWVPVGDGPDDKYHREGFARLVSATDGTYELMGPKVQANKNSLPEHTLIKHSDALIFGDTPREFHALKAWLSQRLVEGIVWHHPDGRMAKIKRRDFGLKW